MVAVPQSNDIIAVYIGALCLGIYLAVFSVSLRWLLFEREGWKLRKNINWVFLAAVIVLLLLDITDSAVDLQYVINPNGSNNIRTWRGIVICTSVNTSVLIADALLIYRCWAIYNKSYKHIILPVVFWIGCFICTVLQACWQFIQNGSLQSSFQPINMSVGPGTVLVPFWGFTIILNAYATFMIIYRVWHVAKDVESYGSDSICDLRFVIRVLMESGVLCLMVTVAHFAVWFGTDPAAIAVLSAMNPPVIGIAFNLIVIRTSQRSAASTFESHEKLSMQFSEQPDDFPTVNDRRSGSNSTVYM